MVLLGTLLGSFMSSVNSTRYFSLLSSLCFSFKLLILCINSLSLFFFHLDDVLACVNFSFEDLVDTLLFSWLNKKHKKERH